MNELNVHSEEYKQLVQRITDYICSLPNGRKLTLGKVIKAVCPEKLDGLNLLDYRLLFAVEEKVKQTNDTVMDLSDHDGMSEGLPYNLDFYIWHKRLQRVRIVSDLLCYGPMPKPDDPVKQNLTISYTGKIWFSEYLFGEIKDNGRRPGRKIQRNIGKGRTARMLSYIADYLESNPMPEFVTDVGSWDMTAVRQDGSEQKLAGPMIGDVSIADMDLTQLIRKEIPLSGLSVFPLLGDDEKSGMNSDDHG